MFLPHCEREFPLADPADHLYGHVLPVWGAEDPRPDARPIRQDQLRPAAVHQRIPDPTGGRKHKRSRLPQPQNL